MADFYTAQQHLSDAVKSVLEAKNNNIYGSIGIYLANGKVDIDGNVYSCSIHIDDTINQDDSVVVVFNENKTHCYIVGR